MVDVLQAVAGVLSVVEDVGQVVLAGRGVWTEAGDLLAAVKV